VNLNPPHNPQNIVTVCVIVAEAWGKGGVSYLSISMFRRTSSDGHSADTARLDAVPTLLLLPAFPLSSLPAVTGSVRDKMTFRVPQSEVLVALPSIWKVITQITGTVHSSIEPQTSKWASDKMTSREP
jgi:hypothetical protein